MLVLQRKRNESIVIDDVVTVSVLEIRRDRVKLGVDAPTEVPVHRREVFDAIHRDKKPVSQEETRQRYQEFRRLLDTNNIKSAYDMFLKYPNMPGHDDLTRLTSGLGKKLYSQ